MRQICRFHHTSKSYKAFGFRGDCALDPAGASAPRPPFYSHAHQPRPLTNPDYATKLIRR